MGAAESRSLTSTTSDSSIRGRIAFHVLRVADDSPAAHVGINPFFDFVVGIAGTPLTASMAGGQQGTGHVEELLARVVEEHEGRPLDLQVWSSKSMALREVTVVPNREWSASTSSMRHSVTGESVSEVNLDDSQPSLLGLSLRLCNPDGALEKVWHVLEILEGSPAESAGLVPFGDYILGYSGGVLHKESDFYKLIEEHVDKPLRLFVYNADFDVTREVVIVPNRAWSSSSSSSSSTLNGETLGAVGGGGLLGCGVGYGVLHRIPKPQSQHQQQQQQLQKGQAAGSSTTTNGKHDETASAPPPPKRMTASVATTSSGSSSRPSPAVANNIASPTPVRSTNYPNHQGLAMQGSPQRGGVGTAAAALGIGNYPGASSTAVLTAPPRSPSRSSSPRPSFAESIEEEEEESLH